MKPIYVATAAVILTALSLPATYGTANAAKFRICKTVASTGVNASKSLAITAARRLFNTSRRSHSRGGYRPAWSYVLGPHCVARRNGWHCTIAQRVCKQR